MFGATPAFAEPLHVGRPNIANRDLFEARVRDILDRRCLTNGGPYVEQFEQRIAEMVGTKYCICTCNATVGLEIAARALGMQGEVIVPAFTFIATAHALQWQGITPVFADVDPVTHTIDPMHVEELITPRTTGIVGVHIWGRACNVSALEALAKRYKLKLLFDAAHAFGCSHEGRPIGSFGDAEVFSFHATKFINSLEGGAIVTNSDELNKELRLTRNFGFVEYDRVEALGTNGKMNEISAAMGLTNLECIGDIVKLNELNYRLYQKALSGIPGLSLIAYNSAEQNNYQYIVIEIDERVFGMSRDDLVTVLHAEKILARRYFYPGCHRMVPYNADNLTLPVTEELSNKVVCLPTGSAVSADEIERVCDIVRSAQALAPEIARRRHEALPVVLDNVRPNRSIILR